MNPKPFRKTAGATLIEYALVCFLVAAVCVLAVAAAGDGVGALYGSVCQAINSAVSAPDSCR